MSYDKRNAEAEGFVIIGNWATQGGETLTDIVNRRSGFNAECFAFIAHDAASRHGFSLFAMTDEGNTLIFRGPAVAGKFVSRDIGPRFSVAETDEDNAVRYLVASESMACDSEFFAGMEDKVASLEKYSHHLDA